MAKWLDLYDNYLRDMPGLSSFTAANELRKAAQEFCRRTKAWRVTLDPIKTIANTDTYEFDLTSEQAVFEIVTANLDGQRLNPLTDEEANDGYAGVLQLDAGQFQIAPAPDKGQSITMKVVLFPSNVSTGIDDALYAQYAEAIASGARARLKNMKDEPFYDPTGALTDKANFESEIGTVKVRVAKGLGRGPLRTRGSFM